MNPADAEEYTQALGQVVSGGWRQIALGERLGVPAALGMSTREWVEDRLGGYLRLSLPERREAVAELTSGEDALSNVQAAEVLGVSDETVRRDRATNVETDEPEPQVDAPPARPEATNVETDEPEPAEVVQELVDQFPEEAAADIRAAQLRANHSRYWSQTISGLLQLDAGTVAETLGPDERRRWLDSAETMQTWLDGYKEALSHTGLRMVSR